MQSLKFTVTHRYTGTTISEQEWQYILEAATWQRMPAFSVRGRSAWHILREEVFLQSNPSYKLRAAKLKGIGVWNPVTTAKNRDSLIVPESNTPRPPTTQPLHSFATYPHLGFNADQEYCIVLGKVAPVGGILHSRAVQEFENAKYLIEKGLPCIVPLGVVLYDEYTFNGQPMGAVISLSPCVEPYRVSEIKYGAVTRLGEDPKKDLYCKHILESLNVESNPASEVNRLNAINIIARKIGKIIHDFSISGLYRYSAEWGNFEYNFDNQNVVLTDLDSTCFTAALAPEFKTLQTIRDLGTLLYRTIAKFSTPQALSHYTLKNLLKFNPLAEVLAGYFPNADTDEIMKISHRLWHAFIPYYFTLKRYQSQIFDDWSQERRRSYKMPHDFFYILAITSVFDLFEKSDLMEKYPSDLTKDKFLVKAENYLGDQYEYFLYLLNNDACLTY